MNVCLLLLVVIALTSGCAMIYMEPHQISGGEKVSIEVERMWPGFTSMGIIMMPTMHEYVEVQRIYAFPPARMPTNGIIYVFGLKWRSGDLPVSVKVEDVTDVCAVVLVDDRTPQLATSCWGGVSAILPWNDPTLKWVQATEDAVRIYRFSVKMRSGNQFQLCQAVTYSYNYAAFIRRHFNPHPSP